MAFLFGTQNVIIRRIEELRIEELRIEELKIGRYVSQWSCYYSSPAIGCSNGLVLFFLATVKIQLTNLKTIIS